ncbi:murein biosynthesis integral membrane protein MurJ [Aestuariivirga sp.]|uniref:murein biosynthesis integral membrane protein MurJ n=1 Tax=Aestuariivirga sp. TaxID=2650926 RepID=UPI0039E59BEB
MSLLKSAGRVGSLTLASRLLGFIRDQLIAFTFGTGWVADAFVVAQRLPNLFRALFAEGAFNNAFVPIFSRKHEGEGAEKAFVFSQDALSVMAFWMLIFCGAAMAFMPWIFPLFAQGFSDEPATRDLGIELTRICFPYLGFMSLTALLGGVLNSLGRFTAAAAAPILLNICMIAFNLAGWWMGLGNTPEGGRLQAWAVTVAGVAQLALLMFAAARAGAPVWPKLPRLTPDVKLLLMKSVPGIISGGVTQINLAVATSLATAFAGGASALYYADRLFQLPLGVIGVAIGVVLLPTLSRKLRAGDDAGARDVQNRSLEAALFLTLPAALALIVIGRPILHVVYEHGAFTREATLHVMPALAAFAVGLPAFTLTKVFQPSFYAREDTRTPMYFAMATVAVNIALSLILSRSLEHVGIALASSIAAWVNALALIFTAVRRGFYEADARFIARLPRILLSVAVMSGLLWALLAYPLAANYAERAGFLAALWGLLVLLAVGLVSYFGTAHLTGAFRLSELKNPGGGASK